MTGDTSFFSRLALSLLFCICSASACLAGNETSPGWVVPVHPAWNADNSRQIVLAGDSFTLFDGSGNLLGNLPADIGVDNEPRWSRSVPSLLYFHSGNQLKSYNVSNGEMDLLQAFDDYFAIAFRTDTPFNGDRFALIGDNRYEFSYTLSSGHKSAVVDTQAGDSSLPAADAANLTPEAINPALLRRAGRLLDGMRAAKARPAEPQEMTLAASLPWEEARPQ